MTSPFERNISVLRAAMLLLAAAFVLLYAADRASAATYTVDVSGDNGALNTCGAGPGDCSLRGAIDKANSDTPLDTIDFSVATATLDAPLDPITEKLIVNGNGTAKVVGSGAYATACLPNKYAFDVTTTQVSLLRLPIYDVCSRPIKSNVPTPTTRSRSTEQAGATASTSTRRTLRPAPTKPSHTVSRRPRPEGTTRSR